MKETNNNLWKVLAIVFIVISILEFAFIVWAWNMGNEEIDNENTCTLNICSGEEYDSYSYDSYNKICSCYKNGKLEHQEYLK